MAPGNQPYLVLEYLEGETLRDRLRIGAFLARYTIEPKNGAPAEGTLSLNLPVSSLQLDRPGPVKK